nr:PREDICTED: uncharacterized protein LOC106705879 [Latimeria chalumnae]|eukprot:XP_014351434.1 PREDICTED: uncharacterized protein LOC106705879 [Latimeria chalumnae]
MCHYSQNGLAWTMALHSFIVTAEEPDEDPEETGQKIARYLQDAKRRLGYMVQPFTNMLDDFLSKINQFFKEGLMEELKSQEKRKSMECRLHVKNSQLLLEYINYKKEINIREVRFHVQDHKVPVLSPRIPYYMFPKHYALKLQFFMDSCSYLEISCELYK